MSPPATSNQAGMLSDWYQSYLKKPPEAATYTAANAKWIEGTGKVVVRP